MQLGHLRSVWPELFNRWEIEPFSIDQAGRYIFIARTIILSGIIILLNGFAKYLSMGMQYLLKGVGLQRVCCINMCPQPS